MMDFTTTIQQFLITYQLLAIFIGAVLFGETVIITASVLAAQGLWSPINVFILALAGTVISDIVWFVFGRQAMKITGKWGLYKRKSEKLLIALERITGKKPFLSLLFIKFLYGTRILTIVYLSLRKMRLTTFAIFDTLGTIFWLVVIMGIGWLSGKSIIDLAPALHRFEYTAVVLVVVLVLVRLGTRWLHNRLIKE